MKKYNLMALINNEKLFMKKVISEETYNLNLNFLKTLILKKGVKK